MKKNHRYMLRVDDDDKRKLDALKKITKVNIHLRSKISELYDYLIGDTND